MTDARIPERFLVDRRVLRLSDAARSGYFMATLWSVSNRTDGFLAEDDLPLIPTFRTEIVPDLVDAGLWEPIAGGWTDTEFHRVQTSRDSLEVLENARRADREKKARQRAHKAGDHTRCTDDTCDVPVSVPGTSPRDSTGEDRTGQESLSGSSKEKTSGEDALTAFARAWPQWPKKDKKRDAEKAFMKAAKSRTLEQLVADITNFGSAYAMTTERKYVPALSVWLNGERWTDDLPTTSTPTSQAARNADAYFQRWGDQAQHGGTREILQLASQRGVPDPESRCTTGTHVLVADGTCARCPARAHEIASENGDAA